MWRGLVVVVCAAIAVVAATWTGYIGVIEPQSVSAQSATCPGDFNGDGKVNLADFLAFAGGFGTRSGDANFNARLDLDGSGAIDLSDFLAFAGVFGTNCEDRPRGSVSGDRAALVALYNATDGPNWVDNTNWLTDAPLGEWYGVETDASGRVVGLKLNGRYDPDPGTFIPHGLYGLIPPDVGRLNNLERLLLSHNILSGRIPPKLGNLVNLRRLDLSANSLTGPIPPELGNLIELRHLDLSINDGIEGEIPPELGNLTKLEELHLWRNKLNGRIPPALGGLTELTVLWLEANDLNGDVPQEIGNLTRLRALGLNSNALTGSLPTSLLRLKPLDSLVFGDNEGLCAPGTVVFAEWLEGMERSPEARPFCNEYDIAALESLYESSGGVRWTKSAEWLGGPALDLWHGVAADSVGRVVELDLSGNGLSGRISASIAVLDRMISLRVGDNALTGPLPLGLTRLSLQVLHYPDTKLCVPDDANLRTWLGTVSSHEGTGTECELSDRDILLALFESTDGANWTRNDNWLTDAPLDKWHGVDVNEAGRVRAIDLSRNRLKGPIPPEAGSLAELQKLNLSFNSLRGEIPRQLGNLTNLRSLRFLYSNLEGEIPQDLRDMRRLTELNLEGNRFHGMIPPEFGSLSELQVLNTSSNGLVGEIPPELGNLKRLARLWSIGNNLTGRIPPELGNLAELEFLGLGGNDLEGEVPLELGNLKRLKTLDVAGNRLAGQLPPELGAMSALRKLLASNNALSGPVPWEFGELAQLQVLSLSNNPRLSGPMPNSLVLLPLAELMAGRTELCVPDEPLFREWLKSIVKRRISVCGVSADAYLIQAVQSRAYPVPLVAGERALLRVFITSPRETVATLAAVRATFFLDGTESHMVEIPIGPSTIPNEVREGELDRSANAEIPAGVIQAGLEMVVEIDPSGTLDPSLGVSRRIPAEGRSAVEVAEMPTLNLSLIPFVWTGDNSLRTASFVEGLHPDHELFWETNHLLPVGALDISKHESVLTDSNSGFDLLREARLIRTMEGGTGHWIGLMYTDEPPGGTAYVGGKTSFSKPDPKTIAHELGHNFSLGHAPCGPAGGPDPTFPRPDGRIGVWGYDPRNGGSLVPPNYSDLMGYCANYWISDYHYTNALAYRLVDEGTSAASRVTVQSLLVSGHVEADGTLALDPAFVVNALPAVPDAPGPYLLAGRAGGDAELFALSFDMPEIAHSDGRSNFVFALPLQPDWAGNLASITLSGPGGSATLDGSTDRPTAILRDLQTGQVRAFLSDLTAEEAAQAAEGAIASKPGVQVIFSRGIPELR